MQKPDFGKLRKELDLRAWEYVLVLLSALILVASVAAYLAEVPLRNLIVGDDSDHRRIPVGKVTSKTGELRRELHGDPEFRKLEALEPVFNLDTVVTASESEATIELEDGATIELSPSSMVQIKFDSEWSLAGIVRHAAVEVVSGKVTGRAKEKALVVRSGKEVIAIQKNTIRELKPEPIVIRAPLKPLPLPSRSPIPVVAITPVATPSLAPIPPPLPSPSVTPSPSPAGPALVSKLKLIHPKSKTIIEPDWIIENSVPKPAKKVMIQWQVNPPESRVQVTVTKKNGPKVLEQVLPSNKGRGETSLVLDQPGSYLVELEDPNASDKKPSSPAAFVARAEFYLNPEIKKIKILDALVGGEKTSSNQLSGKRLRDFAIQLHWEPIPGVEEYRIAFRNSLGGAKLMERKVSGTEYSLNRDKVFSGQIYYEVQSVLESGFVLKSDPQIFVFDFLPPQMTLPRPQTQVTIDPGSQSVLIVWQKTNFTDRYEFQLSRSPEFTELLITEVRPENFFVLKRAPLGRVYARVRSLAKNFSSQFGQPIEFTIVAPAVTASPRPAPSPSPSPVPSSL